jgi:transposase
MASHGKKDFVYVADAALATEENLSLMGENIRFITRLPGNFSACGLLIREAVASGSSGGCGTTVSSDGEGSGGLRRLPSS